MHTKFQHWGKSSEVSVFIISMRSTSINKLVQNSLFSTEFEDHLNAFTEC